MVYCMSDIHGEYQRFLNMLDLIAFSEQDTLYVIGDAIDRGPDGIDVLQKIKSSANMILLRGNHEQMCLDTLGPNNTVDGWALWRENGGDCTKRELLYLCSIEEERELLGFLMGLPDHLDIEVGGQKYHLVHGFPSDDPNVRIWYRPDSDEPAPFKDRIAIIGHTPTCFLTGDQSEVFRIWHGDGIIDIDCGCGYERVENRRLACLRLDDMAEFYV